MAATKTQVDRFLRKMSNDAKKLPLIGKHFSRMGRIDTIINSPCPSQPWLFVSLLASAPDAIGFALVTLFKPTPNDYIMSRVGRGHRGATPNRTGYKKRQLDMYKGLSEKFDLHKFRAADGTQAAFLRGAELARLFGWYLTIIEATTAGTLRWVSQAYEMAGCDVPPICQMYATIDTNKNIIFQGAWIVLNTWDTVEAFNLPPFFFGRQAVRLGKKWTVGFEATAIDAPLPFPPATVSFRLKYLLKTGETFLPPQETYRRVDPITGAQTSGVAAQNSLIGDGVVGVQCEYRIDGSGAAIVTSAWFSYTETEEPNQVKPDP